MVDSHTAAWLLVGSVSIAAVVAYFLGRPTRSRRTDQARSENGAGAPMARAGDQQTGTGDVTDHGAED